jgi:hypothetical protein
MSTIVDRTSQPLQAARTFGCFAAALTVGALANGCMHQPTQPQVVESRAASSPWAAPTSTVQWNEFASELIARNQVGQYGALRTLAYVNVAINNAIVLARTNGTRPEGAAAGAASATLAYLFPKEEKAASSRLDAETAALGALHRSEFVAGIELGRAAASEVIAMAKADRSGAAWPGTVPSGEDKWASLAKPPSAPMGPQLGDVRPFLLASASEFRAPPPPPLKSAEFLTTLGEVRKISDTRSYEQLRYARYWENLTGAFTAGVWNEFARQAIAGRGLGEAESARALALMHMAGFDAILACHDSKYVYWLPRPTQVDPAIKLAVGAPNHPSYPSNHACISGAMGLVLDSHFPEHGGRYAAMARQAGESRIYAGIHYRIDVDEGMNIAQKIASRAMETELSASRPFVPKGE